MEKPAELRINLLLPKKRLQMSKYWAAVLVFLVLVFALFSYLLIAQNRFINSQQAENSTLEAVLKSCRDEAKAYQPVQAMEQAMAVKSKEIKALQQSKVSYTEVVNELDKIKPDQVVFVGAEITPPRVIVSGFSPDHSNVSRMLEGIKTSPLFTRVALLSSEMNESTSEVKFTLELEWEAATR